MDGPTTTTTATLATLIRKAQPIARQIVITALENLYGGAGEIEDTLPVRIETLTRQDAPEVADDQMSRLDDYATGAYALGIAVGMLIHPDTFGTGGRR